MTVALDRDLTRASRRPPAVGPLGRFAASHARAVILAWVAVGMGLGALAPGVEQALSGAGSEASGSESVRARDRIDAAFGGQGSYALHVVVSGQDAAAVRAALPAVQGTLQEDERVAQVIAPRAGSSSAPDGRTAVVLAGAGTAPDDMVGAADDLGERLADGGRTGGLGRRGRGARHVVGLQRSEPLRMLRSELISWPVTLAILLMAFGCPGS